MSETVALELEAGGVVCERCRVAATPLRRLRGLLGRSELPPGEGILLRPCGSVHTMFMRFPIDVVFCDRGLRVLSVSPAVPPWRMRAQRGAHVVVELSAGEASRRGVAAGVQLRVAQ